MSFARFMASTFGRGLRVVAGVLMLFAGWFIVGGIGGTILAVAGLLPIATGLFDVCLLGPLFGAPVRGREALASPRR